LTQNLNLKQQSPSEIVYRTVTCYVAPTGSAGSVIGLQGVQLGSLFICLLCYRSCWPVASVTVLTVAKARCDTVRLRVGRH